MRVGGCQAIDVVVDVFGARAGVVDQWWELVMVWRFIDIQCTWRWKRTVVGELDDGVTIEG